MLAVGVAWAALPATSVIALAGATFTAPVPVPTPLPVVVIVPSVSVTTVSPALSTRDAVELPLELLPPR